MLESTPNGAVVTNGGSQTIQSSYAIQKELLEASKKVKRGILKGPNDGEILTVKTNGKAKQYFSDLKQTKVLVLISIKNNEFCSGEYLGATAQHVLGTYGFTTFLIADQVYWHNLKDEKFTPDQEETLRQQADELGLAWFEKNVEQFLKLINMGSSEFNRLHGNKTASEKIDIINNIALEKKLNFEIVRWQNWVNKKPEFTTKLSGITKLYESENQLKKGIETSARDFAERHSNQQNFEQCFENSKSYLTEESPRIIWIAAALEYNFIAYPGEMMEALKATRNFFIINSNDNKSDHLNGYAVRANNPNLFANWLIVNFRREYRDQQKKLQVTQESNGNRNSVPVTQMELGSHPNLFFKNDSPKLPPVSDYIYGITKAILDYPTDLNTKIDLVVAITSKLVNLNEKLQAQNNIPQASATSLTNLNFQV